MKHIVRVIYFYSLALLVAAWAVILAAVTILYVVGISEKVFMDFVGKP